MKVLQAMAHNEISLEGKIEVEECVIGQRAQVSDGKKKKVKNQVIIAIEKKGKGISRICAQQIFKSNKQNIRPFLSNKIDSKAAIKTNAWSTYRAISKEITNLKPKRSKSSDFRLSQRVVTSLKNWLRGIHGHARHLQFYLNEYCYRFNDHLMKEGLFEKLIFRMVQHKPTPYTYIIAYQPNSIKNGGD
jgi:hypothetical protein